jgi:hypothetical protein
MGFLRCQNMWQVALAILRRWQFPWRWELPFAMEITLMAAGFLFRAGEPAAATSESAETGSRYLGIC